MKLGGVLGQTEVLRGAFPLLVLDWRRDVREEGKSDLFVTTDSPGLQSHTGGDWRPTSKLQNSERWALGRNFLGTSHK